MERPFVASPLSSVFSAPLLHPELAAVSMMRKIAARYLKFEEFMLNPLGFNIYLSLCPARIPHPTRPYATLAAN